ncbi:Wzz/FepE/Etk N-terminal domain-containing protein [Achromobacter insolitus]|uniref:Wzz/FepE/Etk N-terminal domain-containing protein n=1 Tax=Achromobacter insolitus TaxID=217204 RepID=UPI002FE34210
MQDENYSRRVTTGNGAAASAAKSEEMFPMEFIGNMFRNWKILAVAALLGGACGVGAYFFATPKWQASLLVQVGKISAGADRESTLIEGVGQTAYRVRSKEFVDSVIRLTGYKEVGTGDAEPPEVRLFRRSLKSVDVLGTDFLKIDFLGYSPEQLKQYADAFRQEISAAHNNIPETLRADLTAALDKNRSELASEEATYERLTKEYAKVVQQPQDAQLLSASVLTAQVQNSAALIESLRRVQRDLNRRLFPTNLYPTAISKVDISDRPVSPKLTLLLAAGLIVGFICGFLFSVFRRTTHLDRMR